MAPPRFVSNQTVTINILARRDAELDAPHGGMGETAGRVIRRWPASLASGADWTSRQSNPSVIMIPQVSARAATLSGSARRRRNRTGLPIPDILTISVTHEILA